MRQSILLDPRNGYFSNNPLNLWIHTWINYTPKGLTSAEEIKTQNDLTKRNGRDLEGTAIIASISEIEDLLKKGFITKTVRPFSRHGSRLAPRYAQALSQMTARESNNPGTVARER